MMIVPMMIVLMMIVLMMKLVSLLRVLPMSEDVSIT